MALEIHSRIRDNLHGSVEISPIEHLVISHPAMQRLRRIKQTSFLYFAFPGASHSRFEHSLGVLHLASLTWEKIRENQQQLAKTLSEIPDYQENERNNAQKLLPPLDMTDMFACPYVAQTLRLAALMHDIGHPPFSHSGEKLLPPIATILQQNKKLPTYLSDYLVLCMQKQRQTTHEIFTALIIDKVMREVYQQYPDAHYIEPQDIISLVCHEIPPTANSSIKKYKLTKLGQNLLSSDLDIDRMDYLLRDSRECGVSYGVFDYGRILNSLVLYSSGDYVHFGLKHSGLAAFEDFLQARMLMYSQVYLHKTSMAAEAMLQNIARKVSYSIPGTIEAYLRLDEESVLHELKKVASADTREVIEDLFYRRRLWKRIFEATQADQDRKTLVSTVKNIVDDTQEEFEFIKYLRSITNISPHDDSTLRIVRKNRYRIPQVENIETHSRFYQSEYQIELYRFYVTSNPKTLTHAQLKEKILRYLHP